MFGLKIPELGDSEKVWWLVTESISSNCFRTQRPNIWCCLSPTTKWHVCELFAGRKSATVGCAKTKTSKINRYDNVDNFLIQSSYFRLSKRQCDILWIIFWRSHPPTESHYFSFSLILIRKLVNIPSSGISMIHLAALVHSPILMLHYIGSPLWRVNAK